MKFVDTEASAMDDVVEFLMEAVEYVLQVGYTLRDFVNMDCMKPRVWGKIRKL